MPKQPERNPSARPSGDYEVGYGKPPKQHRFQKGRSGNPGGRRTMTVPVKPYEVWEEELSRPLRVQEGGEIVEISAYRACVKRLLHAATRGDQKALALVMKLAEGLKRVGERAPTMDEMAASLTDEERAALPGILAELGKYLKPESVEFPRDEGDEPDGDSGENGD